MGFWQKIFGDLNEKELNKLKPIVEKINSLESDMEKLSDEGLKKKTIEFKKRIQKRFDSESYKNIDENGKKQANVEILNEILPEAFAAVRETSKRKLGQRHYDVQLLGAMVLHQGKIAEMRTGEGKTLVASLALYLNSLTGKGCHLITPNDYLSRVGGGWMGPIYESLGVSVGVITHDFTAVYDSNYTSPEDHGDPRLNHWKPVSRKEAYAADITYGTNNEFGFDYLRDNMANNLEQVVQRPPYFSIVDEVDSILIDEARTPLIISAPAEESANLYQRFASLVPKLENEKDFTVDEKERSVTLSEDGIKKMEDLLGVGNIYNKKGVKYVHHLEEALKAHYIFKKDTDYVVKSGEIVIVDQFTGRLMPGRRYSGGLHQAIEAKEGVEVQKESDTLATISFQNLFRMYEKLSGMTGTAATEAEEFSKIYDLDVVEIPTHRPVQRSDRQDEIYKNRKAKFNAIIERIKEKNKIGQPVLVGTISIETNEYLSMLLKRNGIKHKMLNAKNHESEAKIVADAGRVGAVTLATNMAGRGVDIILGGEKPKTKSEVKAWEKSHQEVLDLGGLCVIGTERHESRRIDNQLRGRAGRQGDPGESQFFVSMEDDLMRIFGGERIMNLMNKLGLPDDQPITHSMITRSIEQAQRKVEGHNFDIRKHLVEYDDVMNKHRESVYKKRNKILNLDHKKDNWLHEELEDIMDDDELKSYTEKVKLAGIENIRALEKMIYLRTIDTLWVEHLNTMTELREGIGLRGYGQRDPLVEYKQEAFNLFQNLIAEIENQVIDMLLKIKININAVKESQKHQEEAKNLNLKGADQSLSGGAISNAGKTTTQNPAQITQNSNGVSVTVRQRADSATTSKSQTVHRTTKKVGRNDPCPCGAIDGKTGKPKKYKRCCGK